MKHKHFLDSVCRFILGKKKNLCASQTLANNDKYVLHAATSPCQCSGCHGDKILVKHLLPKLSDCVVSTQLATISILVYIERFTFRYSPTVHVTRTQRWLEVRARLWMCARQRWQWSDLIDRGVEKSIRGLLRAPEAACCVLLNLIPL